MKEGGRANALLVELLLVIFFFMLCAGILVQLFGDAKLRTRTAAATNASMLEAQNVAEEIYASDDPEAVLKDYGFTSEDGTWVLQCKGYVLKVVSRTEETAGGALVTYDVSGIEGENTLITLPSTRYIPKEVSP